MTCLYWGRWDFRVFTRECGRWHWTVHNDGVFPLYSK